MLKSVFNLARDEELPEEVNAEEVSASVSVTYEYIQRYAILATTDFILIINFQTITGNVYVNVNVLVIVTLTQYERYLTYFPRPASRLVITHFTDQTLPPLVSE